MNADPRDLAELETRLAGLEDRPVDDHPDALEAVHRAVVAQLDALSGVGAPGGGREADSPD